MRPCTTTAEAPPGGSPPSRLLVLIVAVVCASTAGAAPQGAAMRDFENRVEGTTARFNAAFDWRLVGLHRSIGEFGPNSDLQLRFFLPEDGGPEVAIEATELVDFKHYLMRAKPSTAWRPGEWNTFGPWPTRDVIDPLQIRADNLAILGSYKHRVGTVYLPVDLRTSASPAPSRRGYTLYFETTRDIQTLSVLVNAEDGRAALPSAKPLTCNRTANANCRLYAAMTTQAVDLPMDSLPTGRYQVILRATVPRSVDRLSLQPWVYHARPDP
jgi:hypothetical protein